MAPIKSVDSGSSPTPHFQKMGGRYRPISWTYWASLLARLIRLLSRGENDLITHAARLDIDRIIRAIWFDPVMISRRHSLKRVRWSATCSRLSWLLPPMGMQHACLLLEHIGGSLSGELLSGQKREGKEGSSSQSFKQEKVDWGLSITSISISIERQ